MIGRTFWLSALLVAVGVLGAADGGPAPAPAPITWPTEAHLVACPAGLDGFEQSTVLGSVWYLPSARVLPGSVFSREEVSGRAADLGNALGFWMAQCISLEACIAQYPDLAPRALQASQSFARLFGPCLQQGGRLMSDATKGEVSMSKMREEVMTYARRAQESTDPSVRAVGAAFNPGPMSREICEAFVAQVEMRSKGGLEPASSLRAFSRLHPILYLRPEGGLGKAWARSWLSDGHEKSHGVRLTLLYPGAWEPGEGTGSTVVHKFRPSGERVEIGMPMALIQIIAVSVTAAELENREQLRKDVAETGKAVLPPNVTVLATRTVDMAGTLAQETIYRTTQDRPDGVYQMKSIDYALLCPGAVVKFTGSVTARSGTESGLFEVYLPLFRSMAGMLTLKSGAGFLPKP